MKGVSKAKLQKKVSKSDLEGVTRDPEDLINELESLRGNLRKLGVIIDDTEIITHILPKLPEEYQNTIENMKTNQMTIFKMLTIKIIWYNLLAKYNKMNVQYNQKERKESDKH